MTLRTIGIRQLKAQLSRTLRDVQDGDVYLVTDRGRVVAELRQPMAPGAVDLSPVEQGKLHLAGLGELRVAERPRVAYRGDGPAVADGTAQAWLDWTRGDR
jgi:antitoxin (DNA-binding transcriptional repressor) of toxin-antitoxin stability system